MAKVKNTHKTISVQLPVELMNKLRNIVYFNPDLSLRALIEHALTEYVKNESCKQRPVEKLWRRATK